MRVQVPLFPLQIEYHIKEINYRIVYISISFLLTWIIIFIHKFYFFHLFCHIYSVSFIFTYLSEALISFLWFSSFFAFLFIIPNIFYHIYQYFTPGLYANEMKILREKLWIIGLVIMGSIWINYEIILPNFIRLLIRDNTSNELNFTPKISEFISFIFIFSITIFILFLIPTIFFFFIRKFPFLLKWFSYYRIYFYFFFSCFISILTPPDLILVLSTIIIFIIIFEILLFFNCLFLTILRNREGGA